MVLNHTYQNTILTLRHCVVLIKCSSSYSVNLTAKIHTNLFPWLLVLKLIRKRLITPIYSIINDKDWSVEITLRL